MLYETLLQNFGLKVKFYRLLKKISQEKLAELTNIDEHRISDIECGKCNLTIKTINKISNALDVSVFKLFNFDE